MLTVWSYASIPSLSRSKRWYSVPSRAVRFNGALHIQSPLVHGRWVDATWNPLLRPNSYQQQKNKQNQVKEMI